MQIQDAQGHAGAAEADYNAIWEGFSQVVGDPVKFLSSLGEASGPVFPLFFCDFQ